MTKVKSLLLLFRIPVNYWTGSGVSTIYCVNSQLVCRKTPESMTGFKEVRGIRIVSRI